MLAPHIKKNVDKLWNLFWTAGITNPLVAVEQITYLLFLKRLEGIDNERVKKGRPSIYKGKKVEDGKEIEVDYDNCRWRFIEQDKTPQHLINVVFPWLRDLEKNFAASQTPVNGVEAIGGRMSDAYFQLDPNKGAILQQAIDLINKLFVRVDTQGAAIDIMGDTFEYLLSEIATAGKNGQFRTPRHIIRSMVEMLDPQPGEHIIDPAAGTGGFLFSSLSHILARHTTPESLRLEWDGSPHRVHGDQFTSDEFSAAHKGDYYVGLDNDRTMVRIGWINMILHGIEHPQIHQRDSLGKRRDDDRRGPVPVLNQLASLDSELDFIRDELVAVNRAGCAWREMAVVYRWDYIGEKAVKRLRAAKMPVQWLNEGNAKHRFDPSEDSIKVLTMHSSKGLEFPVVAIPALDRMSQEPSELQEEAKLLYVAMTRAMDMLLMTCSKESEFVRRIKEARSHANNGALYQERSDDQSGRRVTEIPGNRY